MSSPTFLGAQRVPDLVNREKHLRFIHDAIYEQKNSCVIFIKGQGGMGKSRLAEEILWRSGNWRIREQRGGVPKELDWSLDGKAVIGDIIDVSQTLLHARLHLIQAIRDALIWPGNGVDFSNYDAAFNRYQSQRVYMGDFEYLRGLADSAEAQFWRDYQQNAKNSRLVIVLDTAEKLAPIGGTELLLREKLLQEEDLKFYTYQWLLNRIAEGSFVNTVLILVGRGEEGRVFFENVTKTINEHSATSCKLLQSQELEPFSFEETSEYFQKLAAYWQKEAESQPQAESLASMLTAIANDKGRLETLWIYTGGQPVRLALYTDLILEDWMIPEQLQQKPEEARRLHSIPNALEQAQKEIEAGFIRLLFGRPNLRAEILKALVRAPRGLTSQQLLYCLYSDGEALGKWLERLKQDINLIQKQKEIDDEIKALKRLAIVKIRGGERIGLQDEVYRIYKNALQNDPQEREAEKQARQSLYERLEKWAQGQLQALLDELSNLQTEDERHLRIERPSQALEVHFRALPPREQEERTRLRNDIRHWELEELHYALLRDFTHNFNHELFELGDEKWTASDEDAEATIQAELWQLLTDPAYALEEFGEVREWDALQEREEKPLTAFRRIALQNDVVNWIKRFGLRKDYERAISFADQVERKIQKWISDYKDDPNFLPASWNHTLARHERTLWRSYACILKGENIENVLATMQIAVQELEQLLDHKEDELVFAERAEQGFQGHPAESKLQRLIAIYHNYVGYGFVNQGNTTKGIWHYGKSLRALREANSKNREATVRNNLARVLSDRGYARGRRLCLDALALRKAQGVEVPIAYSYNTLALIDNDHNRPDLAWVESAIAFAYFRGAEDPRGRGLALLQLAEALRRLSKLAQGRIESFHLRGDSPEVVLATAKDAIDEAIQLFTEGPAAGEKMRRLEAWIEKGCLERDYILFSERDSEKERHYRDALHYLELATRLAKETNNRRLMMDAGVNTAWVHYHFKKFDLARDTLNQVEKDLPADCRFQPNSSPPQAERDDIYLYQQLSKMHGLRGRMALEEFNEHADVIKQQETDPEKRRRLLEEDETIHEHLKEAARNFVLALAYSQLQSPRASVLSIIYDTLYEYLRKFNLSELNVFYTHVGAAHQEFNIDQVKPANFGDLNEFLKSTFGLL